MSDVQPQFSGDPRFIPRSPRLHWTAVLVLSIVSRLLFWGIWLIVQAHWVKKVTGRERALKFSVANLCVLPLFLLLTAIPEIVISYSGMPQYAGPVPFDQMLRVVLSTGVLVAACFSVITAFVLRAELQSTPIALRLSGPLTFFFGPVYFQYFLEDLPTRDA